MLHSNFEVFEHVQIVPWKKVVAYLVPFSLPCWLSIKAKHDGDDDLGNDYDDSDDSGNDEDDCGNDNDDRDGSVQESMR